MQPTTATIQASIHQLRPKTIELEDIATRKTKINQSGARGHTAVAPTPINLTAADLLEQTFTLTRALATAAGLRYGRDTDIHALLTGLDREQFAAALADREDARDVARLLCEAHRRMDWLLGGDESHRCIGVCPTCGYGVWLHEREDASGQRSCVMCGAAMRLEDVAAAHRLKLMTSGVVGTAGDLARLLRACGYAVRRNTINQWAHRGRLAALTVVDADMPMGRDAQGEPVYMLENTGPVYRLGDVLRLLGAAHMLG